MACSSPAQSRAAPAYDVHSLISQTTLWRPPYTASYKAMAAEAAGVPDGNRMGCRVWNSEACHCSTTSVCAQTLIGATLYKVASNKQIGQTTYSTKICFVTIYCIPLNNNKANTIFHQKMLTRHLHVNTAKYLCKIIISFTCCTYFAITYVFEISCKVYIHIMKFRKYSILKKSICQQR